MNLWNYDIEIKIINSIIYDIQHHDYIFATISSNDFCSKENQSIFERCKKLHDSDKAIDINIVLSGFNEEDRERLYEYLEANKDNKMSLMHLGEYMSILKDYKHRRILSELSEEAISKSSDLSNEFPEVVSDVQLKMDILHEEVFIKEEEKEDEIDNFISNINNPVKDKFIAGRETGWKKFDSIVTIAPNKMVLISGSASDGKTRFVTMLITRIMDKYKDVACQWYTLEDTHIDLFTSFLSNKIYTKPKDILRGNLTKKQKEYAKMWAERWKSWDIEFEEKSSYANTINAKFRGFCKKRPDKFNILIVDNILSLEDANFNINPNVAYDSIMKTFATCKRITNGCIILIHHFKDAQMDSSKVKTGFRPNLTDIKGTEAFRRVPNYVLMINNIATKKELFSEYDNNYHPMMKNLFIIDPGKLRDDSNQGDESLIRMYANLDYSLFIEY